MSEWSSDVCSSELADGCTRVTLGATPSVVAELHLGPRVAYKAKLVGDRLLRNPESYLYRVVGEERELVRKLSTHGQSILVPLAGAGDYVLEVVDGRSEEHTSELQSLMRISYAVFCLKNKKQ